MNANPNLEERRKMLADRVRFKPRRRRERTEVSCCIKYLVFGFNVLFWFLGIAICAIGVWAWSEKDVFSNLSQLATITVDPALMLIICGLMMFVIGFTGCTGALRENTCLLLFYCVSIGVIFFAELILGILGFVYKNWVKTQIRGQLKHIIVNYREDLDLQNLIDWVQADWLSCCGVEGPNDWDFNMYFNCSAKTTEKCGVPFSCCKPVLGDEVLINKQCGYHVRHPDERLRLTERIYTAGCLPAGEKWLEEHLIPVAGVVVCTALIQILGICFAQNLRSDIFAQRAKWQ